MEGGAVRPGAIAPGGYLLVVQSEPGDVVLVEATPEAHREVARLAALSDQTWNSPTIAGDRLLVRNAVEAACYRLPLRGGAAAPAAGAGVGPLSTDPPPAESPPPAPVVEKPAA